MILQGDCLDVLKTLDDASVQCCVTSPPYFGLRDYQTAKWEGGDSECDHRFRDDKRDSTSTLTGTSNKEGFALNNYRHICGKCGAIRIDSQIGLESTPDEYVAKLVAVFREVKRVLKDDGVMYLNLGDSYFSGSEHAKTYGTSGKEPVNYQDRGCLCENLCDACRRAYLIGKSHNDNLPSPILSALPSETNHERKELQIDHLPTSDSFHQEVHSATATLDSVSIQDREDEPPLSSPASTIDESYPQHQGDFRQSDNSFSCQLCGSSFYRSVRECEHKSGEFSETFLRNQGNVSPDGQQENRNQHKDMAYEYCKDADSYPYYTTAYHLKPKDLIGIPWMVAFALRADGWYLRQDIIWAKPNPMPESVKDRCTKSHEYIFLLSKGQRYYYDADSIREPNSPTSQMGGDFIGDKKSEHTGNGHSGLKKQDNTWEGRNKRDVWTVTTKPYKEAHFATFPPDLIEPCILAGSKPGDVVLDPFNGSGTTGAVAIKHHREYIGIELNPKYITLTEKRLRQVQPVMLFEESHGS